MKQKKQEETPTFCVAIYTGLTPRPSALLVSCVELATVRACLQKILYVKGRDRELGALWTRINAQVQAEEAALLASPTFPNT